MTAPEIAIVAPNTLTSLGLQNLLEEIIPMATIRVFRSFAELMDDTPIISSLPKYISSIPRSSCPESPRPSYWQAATTSLSYRACRP